MPGIVHFEIPSDDIERSKRFYNELFGWTIEDTPRMNTNVKKGMRHLIITIKDRKGNPSPTGGIVKDK